MKKNLVIYRKLLDDKLCSQFLDLTNSKEIEQESLCYQSIYELIEIAIQYGFYGNLWQSYITLLLVMNENTYSLSCERNGDMLGSIHDLAENDFSIMKNWLQMDLTFLKNMIPDKVYQSFLDFKCTKPYTSSIDANVLKGILSLRDSLAAAKTVSTFKEKITEFYQKFGVGKYAIYKAFSISDEEKETKIFPISNMAAVHFSDLVGYEIAKKKLIDNTESFIQGKRANNCLLFGDAGTGKSTSIKALVNEYFDKGLRIIEIYKHQFQELNAIIAKIKNRNYKFILYMDDLSFEEFEIEYKYLKAVIEGGLQKRPDNILIYATSNRRHLVKEFFSDKEGRRDHLHASDTVQEKLSLAARFGVNIFFCSPDKLEFQNIVKALAEKNQIKMNEDELFLKANQWELSHGGLSGRTAQQFIDYLLGSM